jgi:hypothetical protein
MRKLQTGKQNIVIRHSIREPIMNAQDSQRQKLTKEGVLLAQRLGKQIALYADNFAIFHSPVFRCEQTAIEIVNGIYAYSKNIYTTIESMNLLGGFYFHNWDYCSKLIDKKCFLEKWFANEIPVKYILPIKDTAYAMLNKIVDKEHSNVTRLFITHDFNIFCIRSLYSKVFKDIEYPDYLDGLIISNDMNYFENIRHNDIIDVKNTKKQAV